MTKTGTKPASTTEGHKSANVLFLFPWPFGVTESHEHLEYKRIKQLNNSFENKKTVETNQKTWIKTKKSRKKKNILRESWWSTPTFWTAFIL